MVLLLLLLLVSCAGFEQCRQPRVRRRLLRASDEELELLRAEVAELRAEVAASTASRTTTTPIFAEEEKSAPFSFARGLKVWASDASVPFGHVVDLEGERLKFARALDLNAESRSNYEWTFCDDQVSSSRGVLLFLDLPQYGEKEEIFEASRQRFRDWGLFPDLVDADDFSPVGEIAALTGLFSSDDFASLEIREWFAEIQDAIGKGLWRRWKRVAADRYRLSRAGKLRNKLKKFEDMSDVNLVTAMTYQPADLADKIDDDEEDLCVPGRVPDAATFERALVAAAFRMRGARAYEANCLLDVDRIMKRDQEAWDLLRFARRADRARACALGLVLDALVANQTPPDLDDLPEVQFLRRWRLIPGSTDDDFKARLRLATLVDAISSAITLFYDAVLPLATFVAMFAFFAYFSTPEWSIRRQEFLDPLFFGSTDNKLDYFARVDAKYGTDFLSVPHPSTDKYPFRSDFLPSGDLWRRKTLEGNDANN